MTTSSTPTTWESCWAHGVHADSSTNIGQAPAAWQIISALRHHRVRCSCDPIDGHDFLCDQLFHNQLGIAKWIEKQFTPWVPQ